MSAPVSSTGLPSLFLDGPALGVRKIIIGHVGSSAEVRCEQRADAANVVQNSVKSVRHELMHGIRFTAFDKVRLVAVAGK